MSNTLQYTYQSPSALTKTQDQDQLSFSKFSEIQRGAGDCFFWGKLKNPYVLSRCLITLSNTVQSSFNLSPFQLALLKDPIVTAGNGQIRFEGFSHCAGVYARVDVLEDGHEGEFPESGTTNVDFNAPVLAALAQIKKKDDLVLSVGKKEVGFHKEGKSIIERKVPLPSKWLKGLTTVQHYFAESEQTAVLNKMQALQLFNSVPKSKVKVDYYLVKHGARWIFTPMKSASGICVGGIHRLHLLKPLIPLINEMHVYPHHDAQSVSFVLIFDTLRFVFSISRDFWRGFSGEGAALDDLVEDMPDALIQAFDNYSFTNQQFNPAMVAIEEGIDFGKIDRLTARLAAMGLLGYDLSQNGFYYRRLPFKLSRILSLNPRLKNAEKLLEEGKVAITKREDNLIEAQVEGSGVKHFVLLQGDTQKCTCMWFSRNQGERGPCKHILAVKKITQ